MTTKKSKKRIKEEKYYNEDASDVKRLIIIIVGLIIAIVLVYFLTRIFVSKDLFTESKTANYQNGQVNYNTTLIGSMFNKPEKEYYVMILDNSKPESVYYTGLMNNYTNKKEFKVYLADLSKEFNKDYLGTKANLDATNLANFKVTGPTLLKIKDKKITDTYTKESEITEALKYIENENNED